MLYFFMYILKNIGKPFVFLLLFRKLEMQDWIKVLSFSIFGTNGSYFVKKWCTLCEIG